MIRVFWQPVQGDELKKQRSYGNGVICVARGESGLR